MEALQQAMTYSFLGSGVCLVLSELYSTEQREPSMISFFSLLIYIFSVVGLVALFIGEAIWGI